jgi:hypothetical protein
MGRPFDGDAHLRELPIPFGDSGYVALYRFEREADAVYVLLCVTSVKRVIKKLF